MVMPTRSGTPEALGTETLYALIGAVASGPDLDHVLDAVVELLTEATACHACFIYLREEEQLRMRAASRVFAGAVGSVVLGMDDSLCGWVARHRQPAFIREDALSDPRTKLVPELDEERFQSMVAVPLLARDDAIGVVILHTEAPREFGPDVLDFLVHVASLVTGAIDSARHYEASRRQVHLLTALAELSQELAATLSARALLSVACDGVRRVLGCSSCRVHQPDAGASTFELAAASPPPPDGTALAAGPPSAQRLVTGLVAGDEDFGLLVAERDEPYTSDERQLVEAVGNGLAVALHNAELIERLTEENLVRDLFDDLVAGRGPAAAMRARSAGYDLERPQLVVVVEPCATAGGSWEADAERIEARLRRVCAGALCDPGPARLRALLPLGRGPAPEALGRVDAALEQLAREERVVMGRSEPRPSLEHGERSVAEATDAARVAHALTPEGGAHAYGELGAYRYLARMGADHVPDERHATAIATLAAYDARRRTELLRTLEHHLGNRGGVLPTARALFVHPNTLRQRLERIEGLTGLDLQTEDRLSLELALKLARLQGAHGTAA